MPGSFRLPSFRAAPEPRAIAADFTTLSVVRQAYMIRPCPHQKPSPAWARAPPPPKGPSTGSMNWQTTAKRPVPIRQLRRRWRSVGQYRQAARSSTARSAGSGHRSDRDQRHPGDCLPEFPTIRPRLETVTEEPSPIAFKGNLELITHGCARKPRHDRAEFAVAHRRSARDPTTRSRRGSTSSLPPTTASSATCAEQRRVLHPVLYERFRDQLDPLAVVKPFNRFSFAAFYRDYLFREMILRRTFDRDLTTKWLGIPHRRHSPQHQGWPHPDRSRAAVP